MFQNIDGITAKPITSSHPRDLTGRLFLPWVEKTSFSQNVEKRLIVRFYHT